MPSRFISAMTSRPMRVTPLSSVSIQPEPSKRLIVVGQLHEPDAEFMQNFDQAEIVLDRHRVLQAEENRGSTRRLGGGDIFGGAARENEIGMVAKARSSSPRDCAPCREIRRDSSTVACTADRPPSRICRKISRDQLQYCNPSISVGAASASSVMARDPRRCRRSSSAYRIPPRRVPVRAGHSLRRGFPRTVRDNRCRRSAD